MSNAALVEKISQIEDWAFAVGIEECMSRDFFVVSTLLKNEKFFVAREMERTKDFNILKESLVSVDDAEDSLMNE
jgi:hypothetical protein